MAVGENPIHCTFKLCSPTYFHTRVLGLLAGHCHLRRRLFKLGLTDNPTCESCLEEDESAIHIVCDCEAIAYLRFRHLGQFLWNQITTLTPP
jgi:hypothetical protein